MNSTLRPTSRLVDGVKIHAHGDLTGDPRVVAPRELSPEEAASSRHMFTCSPMEQLYLLLESHCSTCFSRGALCPPWKQLLHVLHWSCCMCSQQSCSLCSQKAAAPLELLSLLCVPRKAEKAVVMHMLISLAFLLCTV